MHAPATNDTIVAVSSGWDAATLGIVRLSGPEAFELTRRITAQFPAPSRSKRASHIDVCLEIGEGLRLPATVFQFCEPHSFTGQDIAEIHTVGSLPALRAISSRLIALGARRALPGEFTARAFMNGRLSGDQVEGVLRLISAADGATARQGARLARSSRDADVRRLSDRLVDLLSSVEAGIDFVEEEDVSFITPGELAGGLDELIRQIEPLTRAGGGDWRRGQPHVAIAGLCNAGKSTLFNALAGRDRAIVSPILGATRDVLSVEIDVGGVAVVLQDSAGLGNAADELELAAHLASEQAADQADVVLWAHDSSEPWRAVEVGVCRRIPEQRRALVLTKTDIRGGGGGGADAPVRFAATARVSALSGVGLDDIRKVLLRLLGGFAFEPGLALNRDRLVGALGSLRRARSLAAESPDALASPELVAMELRGALESLELAGGLALVEDVLGRIMAKFCVGK